MAHDFNHIASNVELRNKLLRHFVQDHTSGCWNWGKNGSHGYGQFYIKPKTYLAAHRAAYLLLVGTFDQRLQVCHHCDNPRCINPDHLFLGTQKDNFLDAKQKGRWPNRAYPALFTPEQDHEIAALKEQGLSISEISRRFKHSRQAIYSALERVKAI
jgi:hypothetical protein